MKREEQTWDNEGGHMSSTAGRIVLTHDEKLPFKVILSHQDEQATEHEFATMQECEAFIRRNTPLSAPQSTLYDREAAKDEACPGYSNENDGRR